MSEAALSKEQTQAVLDAVRAGHGDRGVTAEDLTAAVQEIEAAYTRGQVAELVLAGKLSMKIVEGGEVLYVER